MWDCKSIMTSAMTCTSQTETQFLFRSEQVSTFQQEESYEVTFISPEELYTNTAVRKAILLTRFVNLMKWWIRDVMSVEYSVNEHVGIPCPPVEYKKGETRNMPMMVPLEYRKIFATFAEYFTREMDALGDESLQEVSHHSPIRYCSNDTP